MKADDLEQFRGLALRGGLLLLRVSLSDEPMVDAIGRTALARAVIIGRTIEIEIGGTSTEEECSISLYHEVLEAAALAVAEAPAAVARWNEAGFEAAARQAYRELGPATAANANRLLEMHGF